jgi:O-antigen/teichoic acid export membrane protein
MILYRFVGPVFTAVFPPMTHLWELKQAGELAALYHKSAQLVSVLILPTALVISFFAPDLLLLWTKDPVTVEKTHWLLSILVLGTALNSVMNIPYGLQLAAGWTKLSFFVNFYSVLIFAPLTILFIQAAGAPGAAWNWVFINLGYVLITVPIMHRRLLKNEMGAWYGRDVLGPLAASLGVVAAAYFAVPLGGFGFIGKLACLAGVWALAAAGAVLSAPAVRDICFRTLMKLRTV